MTKLTDGPGRLAVSLNVKSRTRRASLAQGVQANRRATRNDIAPRLELVDRAISDLQPPARNVRPPDPAHIREIATSISTLGFSRPVLIDQDGCVLDGWSSVLAARQNGMSHVPCVIAAHLTAAERRVLRIALNRLGCGLIEANA